MDASERLWEIHRIEQLKARYFRLMDVHDWEAFRELFTDDLTVWADETPTPTSIEPVATSADEFVRHVSTLLADTATVHHGHLPEIELTGPDTATGVWAMFDWVDAPSRGLTFQGYGHYHEEYARGVDDRWRIRRLRLTRLRIVELDG